MLAFSYGDVIARQLRIMLINTHQGTFIEDACKKYGFFPFTIAHMASDDTGTCKKNPSLLLPKGGGVGTFTFTK